MKWRFDCGGSALGTRAGHREGKTIRVSARRGWALFGPYVAVPAGTLRARVLLEEGGTGRVTMDITSGGGLKRLASRQCEIRGAAIELDAVLASDAEGVEVRLFCRGKSNFAIVGLEMELADRPQWKPPVPSRPVGVESGKTFAAKLEGGFLDRYLSGPAVMEVGYKGYDHDTVPIVPQAIGVDVGYPGYEDGRFPFADGSLDAIYSSHCYEHIPNYREVLRDWFRMLRIGGFLIIVVPHQYLFERKRQMPSRWNPDHQRFYTPRSLLGELEASLDENGYRIRHLVENDAGFDYSRPPREPTSGCYEIELVVEKITPPAWVLDDGTVRPYPAADFQIGERQVRASPYDVRLDLSVVGLLVWGPYNRLAPGTYEVEFFIDGAAEPPAELIFDVARDAVGLISTYEYLGRNGPRNAIVLRFDTRDADAFFEFRIHNQLAQPGAALIFRGVELRYAPARG